MTVNALPDLANLSDDELDRLVRATEDEEEAISQRRRRLHERIDALRAERVTRLRGQAEAGTLAFGRRIDQADLQRARLAGHGEHRAARDAARRAVAAHGEAIADKL